VLLNALSRRQVRRWDGIVTIDEQVAAVNAALNECPLALLCRMCDWQYWQSHLSFLCSNKILPPGHAAESSDTIMAPPCAQERAWQVGGDTVG
jgi:hypothetical protein